MADLALPIFAGEEQATATKTYTNTLAVLLTFADMIAGRMSRKLMDDLYDTADRMEQVLRDWEEQIAKLRVQLGDSLDTPQSLVVPKLEQTKRRHSGAQEMCGYTDGLLHR